MKKIKIEIKSIYGNVLFSWESENNSQRETLLEAIKASANLSSANLSSANLSYANLSSANLRYANLRYADLSYANLRYANLSYADLSYANLSYANLSYANLSNADLSYANLRYANLRYADLSYANLRYANLSNADLSKVIHNEGTGFLLSQCPTEGAFIGWKKASNHIVKLRVTENAKRSSATTLKCRCSEAEVLDIQNIDGSKAEITQIESNQDASFIYKIGEIVSVTDFDEERFNECSKGIHFFIARESAVQYS